MTINPRIAYWQVVARNSRGDCQVCDARSIPDGWEAIQRGPDRVWLLAQLEACDRAASAILSGLASYSTEYRS